MNMQRFKTYREFWPYYLKQHENRVCQKLHVIGTLSALGVAALGILNKWLSLAPVGLVLGYGFAWIGHFFFEKNRPATFKYPLWSFIADFEMMFRILTRKL